MVSAKSALLDVDVPTEDFELAFEKAPRLVYFWMRRTTEGQFSQHRGEWLRSKGVRFRTGRFGIKVPQVNKSNGDNGRQVVYEVTPTDTTGDDISKLRGDAHTSSKVLGILQRGGTIRPRGKKLALPLDRKSRRWPSKSFPRRRSLRDTLPKKARLIITRSKKGTLLLSERRRTRSGKRRRAELTKSGRLRKNQRKTVRDTITPRYVLVDSVKIPASLDFYEVWDRQRDRRNKNWNNALTRIAKDFFAGKTE